MDICCCHVKHGNLIKVCNVLHSNSFYTSAYTSITTITLLHMCNSISRNMLLQLPGYACVTTWENIELGAQRVRPNYFLIINDIVQLLLIIHWQHSTVSMIFNVKFIEIRLKAPFCNECKKTLKRVFTYHTAMKVFTCWNSQRAGDDVLSERKNGRVFI